MEEQCGGGETCDDELMLAGGSKVDCSVELDSWRYTDKISLFFYQLSHFRFP